MEPDCFDKAIVLFFAPVAVTPAFPVLHEVLGVFIFLLLEGFQVAASHLLFS